MTECRYCASPGRFLCRMCGLRVCAKHSSMASAGPARKSAPRICTADCHR